MLKECFIYFSNPDILFKSRLTDNSITGFSGKVNIETTTGNRFLHRKYQVQPAS